MAGDRTEQELIMQLLEGFKMSAAAARQLGVIMQNTDLLNVAMIVDEIQKNSQRLVTSVAMNRIERQGGLQRFAEVMSGERH